MKRNTFIAMTVIAGAMVPVLFPGSANATCSPETYQGAICWTAATYCPEGFAMAAGQTMQIADYQSLYSLLGIAYGGDGRATFKLPDLRGRAAIGAGVGTGLQPVTRGQQLGAETVALSANQLPPHNHTVDLAGISIQGTLKAVSDTGDQTTPEGNMAASRPESGGRPPARLPLYAASATTTMHPNALHLTVGPRSIDTGASGGENRLPLREPQLVVNACISLTGPYPPRN